MDRKIRDGSSASESRVIAYMATLPKKQKEHIEKHGTRRLFTYAEIAKGATVNHARAKEIVTKAEFYQKDVPKVNTIQAGKRNYVDIEPEEIQYE